MDSETIETLLKKDSITSCLLKEVFSRDSLPLKCLPELYIANEDASHQNSSHWIGLYITPKGEKNIYFDSYDWKAVFKEFRQFLGKGHTHNKRWLQHMLSMSCGQWCMYFLWRQCEDWNLKEITATFKAEKPLINDYVVNYVVEKRFKTGQDVLDRKFLKNQICKQMRKDLMSRRRKWAMQHALCWKNMWNPWMRYNLIKMKKLVCPSQ